MTDMKREQEIRERVEKAGGDVLGYERSGICGEMGYVYRLSCQITDRGGMTEDRAIQLANAPADLLWCLSTIAAMRSVIDKQRALLVRALHFFTEPSTDELRTLDVDAEHTEQAKFEAELRDALAAFRADEGKCQHKNVIGVCRPECQDCGYEFPNYDRKQP